MSRCAYIQHRHYHTRTTTEIWTAPAKSLIQILSSTTSKTRGKYLLFASAAFSFLPLSLLFSLCHEKYHFCIRRYVPHLFVRLWGMKSSGNDIELNRKQKASAQKNVFLIGLTAVNNICYMKPQSKQHFFHPLLALFINFDWAGSDSVPSGRKSVLSRFYYILYWFFRFSLYICRFQC